MNADGMPAWPGGLHPAFGHRPFVARFTLGNGVDRNAIGHLVAHLVHERLDQALVLLRDTDADERDRRMFFLKLGEMRDARLARGHQVAQNSTTYVLPAANSLTGSPLTNDLTSILGAGSPIFRVCAITPGTAIPKTTAASVLIRIDLIFNELPRDAVVGKRRPSRQNYQEVHHSRRPAARNTRGI